MSECKLYEINLKHYTSTFSAGNEGTSKMKERNIKAETDLL